MNKWWVFPCHVRLYQKILEIPEAKLVSNLVQRDCHSWLLCMHLFNLINRYGKSRQISDCWNAGTLVPFVGFWSWMYGVWASMKDIFWTILASLHYWPIATPFKHHWNILKCHVATIEPSIETPVDIEETPPISRVRWVLAGMALSATWRTSEFTSFWAMGVLAWDMKAHCQPVTLVMSGRCITTSKRYNREMWLSSDCFFFRLVGVYMWLCMYASMVARDQIRENWTWRLTRAVVQARQCIHSKHFQALQISTFHLEMPCWKSRDQV